MYTAEFEVGTATWHVLGGRVMPGAGAAVPDALLALLAEAPNAGLGGLGVRWCFGAATPQMLLLLNVDVAAWSGLQAQLRATPEIEWCADSAAFDTLAAEPGPYRRWLDGRGFSVHGQPCAVEASWLPDLTSFARQGREFQYQINIAWRPVSAEERRLLLKQLARLELMAQDGTGGWPAGRLQAQCRLMQARLASPWLIDELIACDSEDAWPALLASLRSRLVLQGGADLADSVLHDGSADELWMTGLGSHHFVGADTIADAGRSISAAALWPLLQRRPAGDAAQGKACDVFVSHSSADAVWARGLCSQLEAQGFRCWIAPRDIPAGGHYAQAIEDALRQSRAIVLLLSEPGLASPHVLRELERAVNYRAKVLPVRLTDVTPQHAFGYLLSGCQWIDALADNDVPGVADRLSRALREPG